MAVTKTIEARGSKGHHTFRLTFEEQTLTNEDIQLNRSRINYTFTLIDDSNWFWNNQGSGITYDIYGNSTLQKSGTIPNHNTQTQTIATGTFSVKHDNDGNKTINMAIWVVDNSGQSYTCGNGGKEDTMTLTYIPRGFSSTPEIAPTEPKETSVTIGWSTSENADRLKIYLDNTLVETKTVSGKSGTFTVTGTAGSGPHSVYYVARRSDTSVESTSEIWEGWSFYDYPHITNVGSSPLIIGNQQTLTLYNPLGRNVTIKMYKNNTSGTELYSGTTSSKGSAISYKFTPNSATLYNSIPNDRSANCVYSVIGATTRTTNTKTYQIKGNEYPTFDPNNWTYSANLTSLTNNNQVVINGYSTITTTINTQATSNYGANIDKYITEWGTISSSTSTITGGSGNLLKMTVYDKRTLPKETSKTIENVPYTNISITSASTPRTNGVEAGVKLNVSGSFFNDKFGTNGVQNALYSAKYYTSTDGTTWSNGYTIPISSFTTSGNYFSLSDYSIHANGSSGGFTIGTQYYVKVEIKDAQGLLATATYISRVTDGQVARDTFKDSNGYHLGINGLADSNYAMKVYGDENVTGYIKEKGYQITQIDITGTTTSLLNRTKDLASHGIFQATWFSKTDGGTSGISDKPTGTTNAGFVCYARCDRYASSSDWTYILNAYVQTNGDMYVAVITASSTGINWIKQSRYAYPIGSIIERYVSDNPSTNFGGTWQRYGTGRVTVDINTSDTNFNTIGKTGGNKNLQEHNHKAINGNFATADVSAVAAYGTGNASGYKLGRDSTTANTGAGDSGNLQPYITVYRWRRTA